MSGSTSACRRGRRRGPVLLAVALALALSGTAVVGYVVRSLGPDETGEAPSAAPTPLSALDVSDEHVPRGPFCAALDQDDIEAALGGPVTHTDHYDSGDRARLASGLTDIAHEYNCGYSAAGGAQARAWVFAAPVTRTTAVTLTRESTDAQGCRRIGDGPGFGTPSATTACRTRPGAATVVTLRGLFGSSWLTCQVTTPGRDSTPDPVRRAERWCVRVAASVGAGG